MTTLDTLTDDQIAALRREAVDAGDLAMVDLCDAASLGDPDSLGAVLEAIREAEAA